MTPGVTRAVWIAIAVLLVAAAALPLPSWLGGPDRGPIWTPFVTSWAIGLLVVVVTGLLAGRLATRVRLPRVRVPGPRVTVSAGALLLALGAAWAMHHAFARNPHLVDEMAQLLHARALLAGRLALPAPDPPEFFLVAHTGLTEAGWVSQYPPGFTLLLAAGLWAGAAWLVNPVLAGLGVVLVFAVARGLYDARTGVAAALLYAASSWVLFTAATYMNHVAAATYALGAWTALWGPRALPGRGRLGLAGLCLAACAATRPLDAVAAAVPVLAWVLRERRPGALAWMTIGGAPGMLAWMFLNYRLYGGPFTMGYTALYGPEHGLGFHPDPWGQAYTPLTALSNLSVAVRRLHIYSYEWPIPALLPLAVWAVVARPASPADLLVGLGFLAVPLLYFFYWHSGYYLGPRLYFLAAPWITVGLARTWWWGWERARAAPRTLMQWDVALMAAAVAVLAWGWSGLLPRRWEAYRQGLRTMKHHPERALAAAGVRQALVIIPESWGSRTIVTLWGMGAPPGLVERAYRRTDTCDLFQLAERAERERLSPRALTARLEALIRATDRPPALVPDWPDPTLRLRPRATLPEECGREMQRDLNGFTLYGNHAWRNPVGLDRGVVFARDLYQRNPALLARYPGWDIWRWAPPHGRGNDPPILTRVRP